MTLLFALAFAQEFRGTPMQSPTVGFADQFGAAMVGADIDGDGIDELVVGQPNARTGGEPDLHVFRSVNGVLTLDQSFREAAWAPDGCMYALDVGDFDGDGLEDVINDCDAGARIFFGSASGLSPEVPLPGAVYDWGLGAALDADGDGATDWVQPCWNLQTTSHDLCVWSGGPNGLTQRAPIPAGLPYEATVTAGGDVDGDGFDDLLVAAGERVFVAYGSGLGLGTRVDVLRAPAPRSADDDFGVLASSDLDGDGFDDVVVGAPGRNDLGAVFVFYGGPNGVRPATVQTLRTDEYPRLDEGFGAGLAGGGDLDGDGYEDLLVRMAGGGSGVQIFFGGPSGVTRARPVIVSRLANRETTSVLLDADVNGDGVADAFLSQPSIGSGNELVAVAPTCRDVDRDGTCDTADVCQGSANVDADGDGICDDGDPCDGPSCGLHLVGFTPGPFGFQPGPRRLVVRNGTPNTGLVLHIGEVTGTTPLASGPCTGTTLDLGQATRVATVPTDSQGSVDLDFWLSPFFVSRGFQLVDPVTCRTTALSGLH